MSFNELRKNFEHLCSPSQLYFIIAITGATLGLLFKLFTQDKRGVNIVAFMVSALIFLFWTWVLNWICKDGYTKLAWGLVLFPYFIVLALSFLLLLQGMMTSDVAFLSIYSAIIIIIGLSMMKK